MGRQQKLWDRYREYLYTNRDLGFSLDISRVRFPDDLFEQTSSAVDEAFAGMAALEAGAIANPDEDRMVGHYWLRRPELAPSDEITEEITSTVRRIEEFAAGVHSGQIRTNSGPFENVLVVGIGGSALGPQFVSRALGSASDPIHLYFLDNTDPDGFDHVFDELNQDWDRTMVITISKSGSTPETRNGLLETQHCYEKCGVDFAARAVAITQTGSELDQTAQKEGWLQTFPMWDWVGGRTSELSAVGLLPAALQGIDIRAMLQGAAAMDEATRVTDVRQNPAALLALMWYHCTAGRGEKDMVILPYKDRLALFSRYLQQLVMESLGKELDRKGQTVHQGIAVYGNKGSTDQHAYVQQLRDGVANFFVTFIDVLRERQAETFEVEPGVTSGDYLAGFLQGTRTALYEKDRDSITITIDEVTPHSVGQLIALYERTVGVYAELIDVNAYHQPGVQAGKKAAARVLDLQAKTIEHLGKSDGWRTAAELAEAMGEAEEVETIYKILERLAANPGRGVVPRDADSPADGQFRASR